MRDYWHQKPVMLRGALAGCDFPIGRDRLMEMACSPERVSRVIMEDGPNEPWEVEFGPFELADLARLPLKGWTLLVQETDRQMPELVALMNRFRFIPNWRLDDIQISLAAAEGSAGPHIDRYDVFLIQSHGCRTWQLESSPAGSGRAMQPDLELALLEDFSPDVEYIAEPGDVLYLPPRVPHWGVAVDECLTYSIGFRMPDFADVLVGTLEDLSRGLEGDTLYEDMRRQPTEDPGHVEDAVLSWMDGRLHDVLQDKEAIRRIFCQLLSTPAGGYFLEDRAPVREKELESVRNKDHILERTAAAYLMYRNFATYVCLYAAGREYEMPLELMPFAKLIAGTSRLDAAALAPYWDVKDAQDVLKELLQRSVLYFAAG